MLMKLEVIKSVKVAVVIINNNLPRSVVDFILSQRSSVSLDLTDSTESGWFVKSDSMFSLTYSNIVYVIDIPKYCSASWETAYDNKFYVKLPIFDRLSSLCYMNIHIMYDLFTYLDDFSLNVGHY